MKMYFFKYTGGKLLDYFKISKEDSVIIDESDLRQATKDIFFKALNDVEIKLIFLPYQSSPIDLFNFLKQEGCLN